MTASQRMSSSRTAWGETGTLKLYDLEDGSSQVLASHGSGPHLSMAFDPTGKFIVTGDRYGVIRVGPLSGEEPHLLLGHESTVGALAVSPDGHWLAGASPGTLSIWPMPNFDQPPFE